MIAQVGTGRRQNKSTGDGDGDVVGRGGSGGGGGSGEKGVEKITSWKRRVERLIVQYDRVWTGWIDWTEDQQHTKAEGWTGEQRAGKGAQMLYCTVVCGV